MNFLLGGAYEGVVQLARAAAAVAPSGNGKLLTSLRARRGIRDRFSKWASRARDDKRPLVWMHASSVGEGLQARPVLEALRVFRPDVQLAYTYYSPSAESFARGLDVDFADYLPFDSHGDAKAALDALRPRVLAFSKLDVWPALASAAHARGVKLALVSATLASRSGRRHPIAAALTRDAFAAFDAVGAVDDADAERLMSLGVREQAISITGDTRYDQVWARAQPSAKRDAMLAPLRSDRPTVVAGSTWRADERELETAWPPVRVQAPGARLIIAPHEPTSAHLAALEHWAAKQHYEVARLSDTTRASQAEIVLVDSVGMLGDLYALADVAYVGGGFHAAGLHSVLEPAAFGIPVLFGPRHDKSRDAGLLAAAGGGAVVEDSSAITGRLEALLTRPETRDAEGARAKEMVHEGLGASARATALITALLDDD